MFDVDDKNGAEFKSPFDDDVISLLLDFYDTFYKDQAL